MEEFVSIPLPGGHVLLVDVADLRLALGHTWAAKKNRHVFYAAAARRVGKGSPRTVYLHNLLMRPERGFIVDHRDGDGLNNRRTNLRISTPTQNQQNARPRINKLSAYKGVTRCKGSKAWRAQIKVNKVLIVIGTYESEIDAAYAYDEAASRHFGDFARVNFPGDIQASNKERGAA